MKTKITLWGIIALVAAIGFSMAACDDGSGGAPAGTPGIGGTYFFEAGDDTYVLIVSDDGTYELTVIDGNDRKTSTGKAKKSGGVYTLTPTSSSSDSAADPFTVTVNSSGVTGVNGTITFDDGDTQEAPAEVEVVPPENVPEEYRWLLWRDPLSSATLEEFSVDNDGKVTLSIGGRPEPNADGVWQAWRITAEYKYTVKVGSAYAYKIEAWTDGKGARDLPVQYYQDNDAAIYMNQYITLTDTPTQYTIYGQKLPKKGEPVRFQCAAFTGTFYLKVISIEEYEPGELTITNFRGTPGLLADKWTTGDARVSMGGEYEWESVVFIQHDGGFEVPATGSSIIVNVYNAEWVSRPEPEYGGWYEKTTPFAGNVTVAVNYLRIDQWGDNNYAAYYTNKDPITFTNGKATINFGQQMEYVPLAGGGGEVPSGGGDSKPTPPER